MDDPVSGSKPVAPDRRSGVVYVRIAVIPEGSQQYFDAKVILIKFLSNNY